MAFCSYRIDDLEEPCKKRRQQIDASRQQYQFNRSVDDELV